MKRTIKRKKGACFYFLVSFLVSYVSMFLLWELSFTGEFSFSAFWNSSNISNQ